MRGERLRGRPTIQKGTLVRGERAFPKTPEDRKPIEGTASYTVTPITEVMGIMVGDEEITIFYPPIEILE